MSTVLDRIENRGIRKGAIQTTVEMCREFGRSEAEAVSLLMKKFGLSEEESEKIVDKHWTE